MAFCTLYKRISRCYDTFTAKTTKFFKEVEILGFKGLSRCLIVITNKDLFTVYPPHKLKLPMDYVLLLLRYV